MKNSIVLKSFATPRLTPRHFSWFELKKFVKKV